MLRNPMLPICNDTNTIDFIANFKQNSREPLITHEEIEDHEMRNRKRL